jgi:hypothetical protein
MLRYWFILEKLCFKWFILEMFSCVALLVDAGNVLCRKRACLLWFSDFKLVDLNEFYKCLLSEPC